MTVILGLDSAGCSGIARMDRLPDGSSRCQVRDDLDFKHEKDPAKRMMRYRDELQGIFARVKPTFVLFEKPHLRGAGTYFLAGLRTINVLTCLDHGVSFLEVPTTTLKVFATGKGKADKEQMKAAARERLGLTIHTDNQSDAALLCYYGWIKHFGYPPVAGDTFRR